jgi:hypothetical protein
VKSENALLDKTKRNLKSGFDEILNYQYQEGLYHIQKKQLGELRAGVF